MDDDIRDPSELFVENDHQAAIEEHERLKKVARQFEMDDQRSDVGRDVAHQDEHHLASDSYCFRVTQKEEKRHQHRKDSQRMYDMESHETV